MNPNRRPVLVRLLPHVSQSKQRSGTTGPFVNWTDFAIAIAIGAAIGWAAHSLARPQRHFAGGKDVPPVSSSSLVRQGGVDSPKPPSTDQESQPQVPSGMPSENAAVAARVILHLASLGRLSVDDIALLGHTQQGMIAALNVRQGSLAKVLSRLVSARVLDVDRRHVQGMPRRLNVYRLTVLGESVARDVRRRR